MRASDVPSPADSIGRMASASTSTVLQFGDVSVVRDGNTILDSVTWQVDSDQRWVILGPNGAGKTTLLQIASAAMHPTSGTAEVLQEALGKVDVFELRPMIGFASTAMARRIPRDETVLDVVLTAAYSVTGRWNEEYEGIDTRRAERVLKEWGLEGFAERRFGSLSDGEQKRVQIARSVMTDPELLLLDEPAASLDLGAREELVGLLGGYADIAVVARHRHGHAPRRGDPAGFTHALLLDDGRSSLRARSRRSSPARRSPRRSA